jgi:hypothetical protein
MGQKYFIFRETKNVLLVATKMLKACDFWYPNYIHIPSMYLFTKYMERLTTT